MEMEIAYEPLTNKGSQALVGQ